MWWRVKRRASQEANALFGVERPHALGYGMNRMLAQARDEEADLYVGHQEVGLWVCARLRREGSRVGVDIEDWYSRDLRPEARRRRPIQLLERIERTLIREEAHVTTTSNAMAEALADAYGAEPPEVVYNAFRWSDREAIDGEHRDRQDNGKVSLHWFSQTIGLDRGLGTFFRALEHVDEPVAVHLRGTVSTSVEDELRRLFPKKRSRELHFHGLVPNHELLSRIAEHDVGLALEKNVTASREYTITNKILQYLLGGLGVVATDTAGQREVAEKAPRAVRMCPQDDPLETARRLEELIQDPSELGAAQEAAVSAAEHEFCWERQVPTLQRSVKRALQG